MSENMLKAFFLEEPKYFPTQKGMTPEHLSFKSLYFLVISLFVEAFSPFLSVQLHFPSLRFRLPQTITPKTRKILYHTLLFSRYLFLRGHIYILWILGNSHFQHKFFNNLAFLTVLLDQTVFLYTIIHL